MKIVITDGATLNPGDLSWEAFEKLADCSIYPNSTYEENLQHCEKADIAITNKVVFDRKTIMALTNLKMICVTATGYNVIDIEAAKERHIVVSNVPVYGTQSVAQMVFALLLELCHHVGHHDQTVHQGKWTQCGNFCYWDRPLIELEGMTMGIVGCGRIGQRTAALANAFGMKVIGFDVFAPPQSAGISMTDIDTLFTTSDVVSLHCPLTPENTTFVNKTLISKMKPTAFLINTSRGPLIHEQDLAEALNANRIAGASLDVLSSEPPQADNPLFTAKNCYITPHIAWATRSARKRLMNTTVENVKSFIAGKPQNIVS